MRVVVVLLSLLLTGCAVRSASFDDFPCRSDEDCAAGIGHICILDPALDVARCAQPGSVPGGTRVGESHDAGPRLDAGEHGVDGGAGDDDAGPAPRDAGPVGDAGPAVGDAGELDAGPDAGADDDAGFTLFPGGYVARAALTVLESEIPGTEPLAGFPLYVQLTSTELMHQDLGGRVRSWDGDDIEVRLAGEQGRLDHEIERYAPSDGQLELWVRVPSLSATEDTALYVYFGSDVVSEPRENPAGVWDDDHRAVWHLSGPAGHGEAVKDSAGANDGVMRNTESTDATRGMIGDAVRFGGFDEAVHISSSDLDIGGSLTVEGWARLEGLGAGYPRIYQKGTGVDGRVVELFVEDGWGTDLGEVSFRTSYDVNQQAPSYQMPQFSFNEWHHYAGVFDDADDEVRIYVDGELVHSEEQQLSIATGVTDHWIGNWADTSTDPRHWIGTIDEVRISSAARAPEWIAASHANQRTPSTFLAIGPVEVP